jgi:Purine catabolism regulatory protein-like family/PucR C-terminal helix-turn-helix domain
MRLRALLETDALGLTLLGGEAELDRPVRSVMTTDMRDPSRYLTGGELVLTALMWRQRGEDLEPFARILAGAGVAGLAVGEDDLADAAGDLAAACERHRLPLFTVHADTAFATITEYVVRRVSGERVGDLAAVVDRHRKLMTSGPAGGGPDTVLDLLGTDLSLRAWVLSPTGRRIAGSKEPLPAGRAARIAAAHLAVGRTGRRGPYRVDLEGTTYSLFTVLGTDRGPDAVEGLPRDPRQAVLSEWLLVVEADAGDWPPERLDLLQGVTQLIAVERDRRDAARSVRRGLAQEVLELVQAGAAPTETAARLRVAAPVLLPGAGGAPRWQVVVASLDRQGRGPAEDEPPAGALARPVLEEVLAGPEPSDGRATDRVAVAVLGDEAVALVPLPPGAADGEPGGGSGPLRMPGAAEGQGSGASPGEGNAADPPDEAELRAETLVEGAGVPLSAGLGDDSRLTLGVSAVVHSAEGLRGALEEARHARRVAAARQGSVSAAGHQELASHVLLLPFVPDDVRRAFTARLLDPLRDYDERHRAELVPTLEAFLGCDGSWTRCASRLHVHVNTLRYRIGRIEQLTGRDLARLEDKLDFYLALRMS